MLKNRLIQIAKNFKDINKKKVNGRVACLGRDVFDLTYQNRPRPALINQQKARVDLLMDWLNGAPRPKAKLIKKYLARQDISPLIDQQEMLPWKTENKIKYFLMDSFSELTDQKFTHKTEGWSFSAHFSDIDHNSDFGQIFEKEGLLSINEIKKEYELFFNWYEVNFPQKNVYYLHFPTNLDTRLIYRDRGAHILSIMKDLENKYVFLKNIVIDENLSLPNDSDPFPYHFHSSTYYAFVNELHKKHISDA